jgi:hypothetical protein
MAKITILENLGVIDKKPTGDGFHYEVQKMQLESQTFFRRQKIKTKTGEVSSCAYAFELNATKWIGTLFEMQKKTR